MNRMLAACVALLSYAPCLTVAAALGDPTSIVQRYAQTANDPERRIGLFSADATMHAWPDPAHPLAGVITASPGNRAALHRYLDIQLAASPSAHFEVVESVVHGELVATRIAVISATTREDRLIVFRIRDGLIHEVWPIGRETGASPQSGAVARRAIERLVVANNRGDADAFLALFDPDARNFHFRRDLSQLGGGPSRSIVDQVSREKVFREMFAKGAPVQVRTVDSLALGEWIVARDHATRPDGSVLDELSIYRVRNDLIVDDWYVAEQTLR